MTFFGRYSDDDRNEFTAWCRTCELPRSLHGGVRLCSSCDLIARMPGGTEDQHVITDADLKP